MLTTTELTIPEFRCSIAPTFHCSIIPFFQYSSLLGIDETPGFIYQKKKSVQLISERRSACIYSV